MLLAAGLYGKPGDPLPRGAARYRTVPGHPSKHGANMGVADARHSQDRSVSQSWTGGLEFAEAAGRSVIAAAGVYAS